MDEIAVPISWFRQAEDPDQVAVDSVCVGDSEVSPTESSLEGSKTSPAVAVYLLQFYPVTQTCMQPCVTANGQLTNTPVMPHVSLSQPTSDGPCYVSQPPQMCHSVPNVEPGVMGGKSNPVKLEPICLLSEQQDIKQESNHFHDTTVLPSKWKEGDATEQPVTMISRVSHNNPVVTTPAKHVTQISAGTLSVCTVRNPNIANPVEPIKSAEHNVRTQPGEKPYSCNLCGKVFARAHNLKAHSQTHSGALPFACKICRKSYSQGAYYRIHSEILSGGRPYTCDVCSKVFCNSRSFNFHIRSHSRRKCIA